MYSLPLVRLCIFMFGGFVGLLTADRHGSHHRRHNGRTNPHTRSERVPRSAAKSKWRWYVLDPVLFILSAVNPSRTGSKTAPPPPQNAKHRGFAFVTFGTPIDAQDAIDNMDQNELQGKVLKVNLAKPMKGPGVQALGNRASEFFHPILNHILPPSRSP